MLNYYNDKDVRKICHAIKQSKNISERIKAISIISSYLSQFVSSSSILVPAPQHTGNAEYTLEVCKEIKRRKGCYIADVLKCVPHTSLYKQKGKREIELYVTEKISKKCLFIDNVISTGTTLNAAKQLLNIDPLVFAKV